MVSFGLFLYDKELIIREYIHAVIPNNPASSYAIYSAHPAGFSDSSHLMPGGAVGAGL